MLWYEMNKQQAIFMFTLVLNKKNRDVDCYLFKTTTTAILSSYIGLDMCNLSLIERGMSIICYI